MSRTGNGHSQAIATLAEGRAGVYRALATLYIEPPSAELVGGWLSLSNWPEMAELLDGPAVACLRRYASAYQGDIDSLRQEFHDLFLVPLGRYVTPYEAVYRDQRVVGDTRVGGLLMGPSTVAVMSEYRASGVQASPDCGELPDHVGIELSFMAVLCGRELEAWQGGDTTGARRFLEREQRFLEAHLLQWVPALSRRIADNASSDFYRGVALLTDGFLRTDAATLAAALNHP
jgi:TorA maturation chaperone TorD